MNSCQNQFGPYVHHWGGSEGGLNFSFQLTKTVVYKVKYNKKVKLTGEGDYLFRLFVRTAWLHAMLLWMILQLIRKFQHMYLLLPSLLTFSSLIIIMYSPVIGDVTKSFLWTGLLIFWMKSSGQDCLSQGKNSMFLFALSKHRTRTWYLIAGKDFCMLLESLPTVSS